nr:InlB B-repeat-containing protein [Acholeplasmatales bacterium]
TIHALHSIKKPKCEDKPQPPQTHTSYPSRHHRITLTPFSFTIDESGDFRYLIIKEDGEEMAAIIELSDSGDEKEVIIIPEYLDGYKVYGFYDRGFSTQWGRVTGSEVSKFYIQHQIKYRGDLFGLRKVFLLGDGLNNSLINGYYLTSIYLPSNVEINNTKHDVYNANVTYYVDNEIYWIDDYDDGLITFIPENPTKEGYTFDGWYKDLDYNNKWDFDTDKVPAKEYGENQEYIYKETKLYAKFI